MIRDITIGQYFPGDSKVHKLDPRMKILLTIVYIVMLFVVQKIAAFMVPVVFTVLLYKISHIPFSFIMKSLKPIIPLLIFTSVLNLFLIKNGNVVFHWWILKITDISIRTTVFMFVRIICLIAGASLLTYVTSPIALTDGIEQLMMPLAKIKFPVHDLAMIMTIALRFIPTLIEETDKIMAAQKARGAKLDSGGLIERIKALLPVMVPLLVSAWHRADELALAMECRCYKGGKGRTRLNTLSFGIWDLVAFLVMAGVFAVTVAADRCL